MIQFFLFIFKKQKVPPIAYVIMCLLSHRIHSIFVLRLFNDPIAMLFLYAAIACILVRWWHLGCILFSLAVSVKMNILLFAPGLFVVLVLSHGLFGAFGYITLCAIVQVSKKKLIFALHTKINFFFFKLILGLPFLIDNPIAYIHRAFEFSRQFLYKWTVNWKCVPEEVFLSRVFQLTLLSLHLIVLLLFLNKILKNIGGLKALWSNKRQIRLNNDCKCFFK
jgi:alpha-1,3-mannosyltransferase